MPVLRELSRTVTKSATTYASDEARWQAVLCRDDGAEVAFVYAVRTTGVYCRPNCPARRALRKNVSFHATCQEAERAGFRACKRCQPQGANLDKRQAAVVARACRIIEESEQAQGLEELASAVGLSPHHFHRMFKAQTGLTPKAYSAALLARRVRGKLNSRQTVTSALYDAGFSSSSRFYERGAEILGMSPTEYKTGGAGTIIRFAVGKCVLGSLLVAASQRGVCAILLGEDGAKLIKNLEDQFPHAKLKPGGKNFQRLVALVAAGVEHPAQGLHLPLDIRGTAFQQRVWKALRDIPVGSTASYTEIARRIGQPKSVRAVARACATNTLAVAIPCHRVVRTSGELAGYRWGIERKAELLRRERE